MNHFKGLIEHSIEPLRVCMIFIMFHRWGYLLQLDFKYRFVIIMIIITEFHLLRRLRRKATNKYASYHSNILDLWCTNDLQTLQAHIRVKHNNDCRGVLRFFSTRYATFTAFHDAPQRYMKKSLIGTAWLCVPRWLHPWITVDT